MVIHFAAAEHGALIEKKRKKFISKT